jgi:hypothetical protein
VIEVCAPDSIHNRQYWGFILRAAPILEIVPKIPDDVGRVPVTLAEELPVLHTSRGTVGNSGLSPSALIKWGKKALQSVCCRCLDDEIDMQPVRLVRCS